MWFVIGGLFLINMAISVLFTKFLMYPLVVTMTYNTATILALSIGITVWQLAMLFVEYMLFISIVRKLVSDLLIVAKLTASGKDA